MAAAKKQPEWGMWERPTTVEGLAAEIVSLKAHMKKRPTRKDGYRHYDFDTALYKDRLDQCEQYLYLAEVLNCRIDA